MKIIVGLGNPGKRYEATRHNIGFEVIQRLALKYKIRLNRKAFSSLTGSGRVLGEEVTIALPQIYMNNSGEAVYALVSRKKVPIKDLLVVCDDVNLSLGVLRIRESGSSGGHNGLSSVIERLNSEDFARLRIGVGKDPAGSELSGYVLSPFSRDEADSVKEVLAAAVYCCEIFIKDGTARAANVFNKKNKIDRKE